jgi:hypothetical protein
MRDCTHYGRSYRCVKTANHDDEIYLHADTMVVNDHGDLIAIGHQSSEAGEHANLAIAAGQWSMFFAASCIDGAAVAVEHWKGEVINA